MKKIVYKTETGIAIITPAHSIKLAMKDIPKGVEYKIIDESELPQDRKYRNAWNYDLKIDAAKKTEIDIERAAIAEKKAMPDIVKELQTKVQILEDRVKELPKEIK